ncbi:unnamed protein product [Spirodela intermedia]|uniref:Uncharacterized protein n=2 Tax=Spirodela intermedia TaxID=51605 RepID=A0A7I8KU24_SPIIN|nr:unnamed protein product [Spirodela intermedia]
MAAISTVAFLGARCATPKSPPPKPATRPPPQALSIRDLSKSLLTLRIPAERLSAPAALAGAVFATLGTADAALAAQQIADIAEGDNRGLALLLPLIPAILWVLYNILQPALNQINRMTSEKGLVVGVGLGGGMAAAGFLSTPSAAALQQIADVAEAAAGGDNRGLALLLPLVPAILWVLYNILQPALNQINRMRSG